MLGIKFYKGQFDQKDYADCSIWCNANNATIEDKGDYYECVAIPAPNLSELKQEKINALKVERDSKEVEPITYNGNSYDYDSKARDRMAVAIIALEAMGADASISWTTADNQDVKVTAADLRAIATCVANRSNALHVAYREAKAKVEQAATVAEVEAITLGV